MKVVHALSAIILVTCLLVAGCTRQAGKKESAPKMDGQAEHDKKGEHKDGPAHADHKHPTGKKEDHAHKPGAHGGLIVSLGADSYHAEVVFAKGGMLQLYTLGKDETKTIDVESQVLKAFVKAEGGGAAVEMELKPVPQAGDKPGRTSQFAGTLPKDVADKKLAVTIPAITISGERFRISFESSSAQHGDAHPKDHKDPHAGHGKHGPAVLMVQTEPTTVEAGKPAVLKLMIHDAKGAMVREFEVIHEHKVHLIIVRAGLDHFEHLHPDVDASGSITAKVSFPVGGTYLLFADYKPKGQPDATAKAELKVPGENPSAPTLKPNVPGKVEAESLSAEISVQGAKKGHESSITFDLRDAQGKPVTDLQPYMGERGHLNVLSADGKEYVHAHPADAKGKADQRVTFEVHFPRPGLFKGWGQFRRQDRIHVIPFVVKVD